MAPIDVPAPTIMKASAATWLAGELDGSSASSESMDPRTAAYALYALTVVGDSETRDSGIRDSAGALADGDLAGDEAA
jgi:hypothetical protein